MICSSCFTVFPGHHVGWTEGLAGNAEERRGGSLKHQTIGGVLVLLTRSQRRSTSLAQMETQVLLCLKICLLFEQLWKLDMMPHR